MATALIALGGNLGDPVATMQQALAMLERHPKIRVLAVSPMFTTAPVGTQAGGEFINAAARLSVELPPLDLLDVLQETERSSGRVRTTHWGPRTLDLDLIGYDDLVLQHERLQVPHPACWYRRFVLDPLAAIAPDWRHPVQQSTVSELLTRLKPRPLPVSIQLPSEQREPVTQALLSAFPDQLRFCDSDAGVALSLATGGDTQHREIPVDLTATPESLVEILRGALDEPRTITLTASDPHQ